MAEAEFEAKLGLAYLQKPESDSQPCFEFRKVLHAVQVKTEGIL